MKLTASALDRVAACPASQSLPHVYRDNPFAKRGTVIHGYLAAVPNIGREAALALVSERYREDCARIDLEALPIDSAKFLAEVAFAFDVETGKGRVLGQNLGRDYSLATENEVVGTADVVGLTDDAVVIPDFKSGHAHLEPKELRQLLFLSLAACRAYGKNRAISGVVLLREDGSSYYVRADFDEFDLAAFELELRDIVVRVRALQDPEHREPFVVGDHCRYCPAIDYCPAMMSLVRVGAGAEPLSIEGATEEQLAMAWERAVALELVSGRMKEAIKVRARQKAIPMGKGQVLGECPVELIKPEAAMMVLEAMHGVVVAEAALEVRSSITKASIERALKKHVLKAPLKIGALNEAVLAAVREAKGVTVRLDVKKRKAGVEDFALLDPGPAPPGQLAPDASGELKAMLEAGAAEHAEALKAEAK